MMKPALLGVAAMVLILAPVAVRQPPGAALVLAETQQSARVYRVGLLGTTNLAANTYLVRAFTDGLADLGYLEGKNLAVEYRWAGGVAERLPQLALDLVKARVDVIVAPGNLAATAAKRATSTIPIVAPWFVDPVATGLVTSLARPGGNVTGLTFDVSADQATKRLELFKELVPAATRVAVLWPPNAPGYREYWPVARKGAAALNISLYGVEAADGEEIDTALAQLVATSPHGMFIWSNPWLHARRREICAYALQNRIPTLVTTAGWTAAGCLMSYAVNEVDLWRRAASYVDKLLRGAKAGDLPVEQPAKLELVLNVTTARALSITIPHSLLLRADALIQ